MNKLYLGKPTFFQRNQTDQYTQSLSGRSWYRSAEKFFLCSQCANHTQPPSQSSKAHQTSHIPRFRGAGSGAKLTPAGTTRVCNGISTDESDFEYRYEVEGRERRKLTVANAENVASSSSSSEAENDVDIYQQQQYTTYGYGQTQRLPGLQVKGQAQDDNTEESKLDISHSRNEQSSSSDAQDLENCSLDLSQLDETHTRRKAALLGLVCGLKDEHSGQSPSNTNDRVSCQRARATTLVKKGLAVGGSLGAGSGSGLDSAQYDDDESESEYGFHVNDGGGAASGVDRTKSRPKSSGVSISSTACTPRTPAVPLPLPVSAMLRRASQYHLKLPTAYSEGSVDTANNGDSKSYSSKRYSLHASSLSPCPGTYDHLPPSPRISTSAIAGAEGDRDKPSGGDSGGLKASHLQARSSPEELIGKRQEKEKESRRKSISAAKSPSSLAPPPSPHAPSSSLPRDGNSYNYESVVLSKWSQEVVVRTRQAFGIPPSESEEIYHRDTAGERNREADSTQVSTLTPADSMASGVDVAMDRDSWEHEGDNELSVGAENLFRTLSLGESENEVRGRSHRNHEARKSHRYEQQEQQQFILQESLPERNEKSRSRERRQSRHRSRTPVARPKSAQRMLPVSEGNQQENLGSSSVLLESHGEMEIQRQEVIWELRNAETSFAKRLSSVVDLFILPLRVHASKSWIAVVPFEIAKILDWLEILPICILRYVTRFSYVSNAGIAARWGYNAKDGIRTRAAWRMLCPYLIKMRLEMLERLVRDDESDFGEFYPDLFRRLLEVTPKTHDEYLSTLMLVHSTALVVKTLMAVKAREEEYELHEENDDYSAMDELLRMDSYHLRNQQHSFDQREPNQFNKSPIPNRMSRLIDAINEWDSSRRSRSGSVESNNSASTGASFRSVETSSPPPPPQILVLVFSDLVVFATNRSHTQEQQGSERWNVCEDVGVARHFLTVAIEPASITVDVLPVQSEPNQRSTSTGGTLSKRFNLNYLLSPLHRLLRETRG
ncbi:hypothetical protein BT96DRAFT_975750 [Gymnopus androsaceus JB14]|uniref:DH domain-containing protein n=1 Tax=Gymnopus androsaceus JB14 TaxID=1447944 RepID=A0A6A4HSI5_9AGAR|nr:hypothetical protein BT96DRAFT_975750 [Gymnopus androsaceus JB14]